MRKSIKYTNALVNSGGANDVINAILIGIFSLLALGLLMFSLFFYLSNLLIKLFLPFVFTLFSTIIMVIKFAIETTTGIFSSNEVEYATLSKNLINEILSTFKITILLFVFLVVVYNTTTMGIQMLQNMQYYSTELFLHINAYYAIYVLVVTSFAFLVSHVVFVLIYRIVNLMTLGEK